MRTLAFALAWIVVLGLGFPEQAWPLDIVKDGKPLARLIVPDAANDYTKLAARWIQEYVRRGTGAELPIVEESKQRETGVRVYLGSTKAAAEAGIRGDTVKWDGCRMVVKGERVFLLGRDEPGVRVSADIGPKGTCRAAVTFLEMYCGVRWLAPTAIGAFVPKHKDIVLPSDVDQTIVPAFGYASGRAVYGWTCPAAYANNFRTALRLYTPGGDTWSTFVPVAKYYQDHPEYFALINGQRSSSKENHLCTSNPDVNRLLLEGIRAKFDEGYDLVQLAQSDGYQRCECPTCEAMDTYRGWQSTEKYLYEVLRENPCERVLMLHRDVAEECLKSHPDKKVHILIYCPTCWPSKKFEKFPDNVVLEVCHQDPRVIAAWRGKAKAFSAFVYWWGTYNAPGPGPKYTAAQVAASLRYLRDSGFQGIYFCGAGECWGLEGHAYYACGKLLGNPDLDPQALVQEYCDGLFDKAAPAMFKFFQALDKRVQLYAALRNVGSTTNNPEHAYTVMYPPASLSELDTLLSHAESLADTDRSRDWVRLSRLSFDYVELTANAFGASTLFRASPSRETLLKLRQEVEGWRAYRDKILNLPHEDVARWFPGYSNWQAFFKSNGSQRSVLGAPFNLDFEKMLAQYDKGGR